jgi:hypothetical protein
MAKRRFSKPIRGNTSCFFSFLLRKNGKQFREGAAVADPPVKRASDTQGNTQARQHIIRLSNLIHSIE